MVEKAPIGIRALPSVQCGDRNVSYRVFILVLTFLCYTSYHLSRKPISIAKSVLHRNCSKEVPSGDHLPSHHLSNDTVWCDWKPFDSSDYGELFGALDLVYLFAYAVSMFFSGHIAERMNLRYFLSGGMVLCGIFTAAFGFGYFLDIHSLAFYIAVQLVGGVFQSTGWPAVVACMGNWYGKGKRGLIMGIWNSHTSIGNILGSVIAGAFVNYAWGWSFVVPGIIIGAMGVTVFFFLVPDPKDVGCSLPDHQGTSVSTQAKSKEADADTDSDAMELKHIKVKVIEYNSKCPLPETWKWPATPVKQGSAAAPEKGTVSLVTDSDSSKAQPSVILSVAPNAGNKLSEALLHNVQSYNEYDSSSTNLIKSEGKEEKPINFFAALRIPGVVEFALCLFFAKLVSYTFLFWLPKYISEKSDIDAEKAADLSTSFDFGGIAGGITAGLISDYSGARATTCCIFLLLTAPTMYIYNLYGSINLAHSIGLSFLCGFMVNAPYALITTAVSADLGTHKVLKGNSKALATVTAIIDGTGSIGAAIGPLLTGVIERSGWNNVFYMLIAADIAALLLLIRLLVKEIIEKLKG